MTGLVHTSERCGASAGAMVPPHEIVGPAWAPVVVVLGGISATRHLTRTDDDPSPGWWEPLVGPGRAIDTERVRALGVDFLDGGRDASGRPARIVTTHDQADALAAVLDGLDVERVQAIVGASYGGMVALAFGERYPERVERLVAISAPHEAHPMSTALRAIQRRVVELGLESGRAADAMALARALAMTTYRSAREFGERFDPTPSERTARDATFPVERYLLHCGRKFAAAWEPARFLALSLSGDLHRVSPERITVPTTVVAAEGDAIVPRAQLEELVARLAAPRGLVPLPTINGHDAFLTEPARMDAILRDALTLTECRA